MTTQCHGLAPKLSENSHLPGAAAMGASAGIGLCRILLWSGLVVNAGQLYEQRDVQVCRQGLRLRGRGRWPKWAQGRERIGDRLVALIITR